MKKKVLAMVMALMVVGAGSAFAETAPSVEPTVAEMAAPVKKLALLKEFQDEIHALNVQRSARLATKSQIVQKKDQTLSLTIAAKEAGDKDALKQAAQIAKTSCSR